MEVVWKMSFGRVVWAWSDSGGQTLAAGAEYVASDLLIHRVSAPSPLGWPAFAAAKLYSCVLLAVVRRRNLHVIRLEKTNLSPV